MDDECEVCGCSEMNACVTVQGPCWWLRRGLCSRCATKGKRGAQLLRAALSLGGRLLRAA